MSANNCPGSMMVVVARKQKLPGLHGNGGGGVV